jgi:folate-binding protein YgfZ
LDLSIIPEKRGKSANSIFRGTLVVETAFREAWTRQGAILHAEDLLPRRFGDRSGEYDSLNQSVGLAWCSDDLVEVQGQDRAKFVHNFCTNEIVKLPVGQGCEAFFLTAKGKVFDYGRVYSVGESLWIDLEHGRGAELVKHLDRFLFREDVRLFDRSTTHAQIHVGGPEAEALLRSILGADSLPPQEGHVVQAAVFGVECQIRGRSRSVHMGYDFVVQTADALRLWSALLDLGTKHGLKPVGEEAMEIARVEASLPRFGREITPDNLPQEIGRDSLAISFNKGCYIGQETVARLDAYGHVNKLLRGLIVENQASVELGQPVTKDGKVLGTIATAVDSPRFGTSIALAVLRVAAAELGSSVNIETSVGAVSATVVELPFRLNTIDH